MSENQTIEIRKDVYEKLELFSKITGDTISNLASQFVEKNIESLMDNFPFFFETYFPGLESMQVLKTIFKNIETYFFQEGT